MNQRPFVGQPFQIAAGLLPGNGGAGRKAGGGMTPCPHGEDSPPCDLRNRDFTVVLSAARRRYGYFQSRRRIPDEILTMVMFTINQVTQYLFFVTKTLVEEYKSVNCRGGAGK